VTHRASFIVTGPAETVVAQGIKTGYDDVNTAAAALRDGRADLIVGALPFDIRHAAALIEPISVSATLPARPAAASASAHAPIRPRWPLLRKASVHMPIDLVRSAMTCMASQTPCLRALRSGTPTSSSVSLMRHCLTSACHR
jgi:hypothetical protein